MGWTDRGSDGEDGTDGVSGYQQVFSTPVTLNTLGPTEASAVCPVGKVVLGGSFILPQASPNRRVLVSAPVSNASWLVRV